MNRKFQKKYGIVNRISGSKSIRVTLDKRFSHPRYKKIVYTTSVYIVHDELEQAKVGDKVCFVSCKPISAKKHHRLFKIVGDDK